MRPTDPKATPADFVPVPELVLSALYQPRNPLRELPADFWRSLPALDPVPRINAGFTPLNPEVREVDNVRRLVSAYHTAHEQIYKRRSFAHTKGNIENSKQYRQFCEGMHALLERQYSPVGWALWVMGRFYKRRSPSFLNVFGAKFIASKSGWFRKEYDGPSGWTPQPTRANYEQYWRRQDAIRQARGMSPIESLYTAPPWYAGMRMEELLLGYTDPLTNYTRILTPRGAR